jgi:hypothetical protein
MGVKNKKLLLFKIKRNDVNLWKHQQDFVKILQNFINILANLFRDKIFQLGKIYIIDKFMNN